MSWRTTGKEPAVGEMEATHTPPRCRSKFAAMRCELLEGHLLHSPPIPHAHQEWRWNRKIQWTAPALPIEVK